MRLSLLSIALLLSMAACAQVSVPNSGFEEGDGLTIQDWTAKNNAKRTTGFNTMVDGQHVSVAPFEGQYFLELATQWDGATAKIGSVTTTVGNVGYPDSFGFRSIYFGKIPEDNYVVELTFLKYDPNTHKSSTVLSTSTSGLVSGTTWKNNVEKIWYFGTTPEYDSLQVTIMANNPSQHDPATMQQKFADGTTLVLDDFLLITHLSGIDEKQKSLPAIKVYPNPSRDNFNLSFANPTGQSCTLEVFDAQGNTVFSTHLQGSEKSYDLSAADWKAGMYICRLSTATSTRYSKLIRVP